MTSNPADDQQSPAPAKGEGMPAMAERPESERPSGEGAYNVIEAIRRGESVDPALHPEMEDLQGVIEIDKFN
ncbi:MAG: hypothetical protein AAFV77_04600, partial [Planctomycetota bacterium]